MSSGKAAGLGAALLTGWAVTIPLLGLYTGQTDAGGSDLALALGAMAAGLIWPRIAPVPTLPVQLLFVVLLILPFFVIAFLLVQFIAMVLRNLIGVVLDGFGLSAEGGSHQFGVDPGAMALAFVLCFLGLRAGIALSLWGRH